MNLKNWVIFGSRFLISSSCVFIPLNDSKNGNLVKALNVADSNRYIHSNDDGLDDYAETDLKIKRLQEEELKDTQSNGLFLLRDKLTLISKPDSEPSLVVLPEGMENDCDEDCRVLEKHGMIAQGLTALENFYFKFQKYRFDDTSKYPGICLDLYDNEGSYKN